jgi:16S rRNA (guanine966-N2)-methyltransferase
LTAARPRAGEVRLIGGAFKRSKLPVPDRPGLRPTPDRVRETLFNWLGQGLAGWRVLDAFAGSGALGFEAASRGASEVLLLETDAAVANHLVAVKQRLQAQAVAVQRADAMAWMAGVARGAAPARFELVLLDPPFDAGLAVPAATLAAALVVPGGFVYVESGGGLAAPPAGLEPWRELRAGAVTAQLLRRPGG